MVMKRKGRRNKRYLGQRSHGRGDTKNRRGSGNRGGRGMAGVCKHKWSWATKYAKEYYGAHGFVRPTKKHIKVIHLYEINHRAVLNKLEKKEDKYQFDFRGKVLATGNVTVPLSIRALSWSKNAEKKLSERDGEISKLEK